MVSSVLSAVLLLSIPAFTITIPEIQGPSFNSPYINQAVTNVTGIVTAIGPAGFWLRNLIPDRDIRTSESIYVYTGASATSIRHNVIVGETVTIDGKVEEYRRNKSYLFLTEITGPKNLRKAKKPIVVPKPVLLNRKLAPPTELFSKLDTNGDVFAVPNNASLVETSGLTLEPKLYGLDFWESLEGELVTVKYPTALNRPNNYGEIWVRGGDWKVTSQNRRGGLTIIPGKHGRGADANPEAIIIGEPLDGTKNDMNIRLGDSLTDVTGVITYAFGFFRILPTTAVTIKKPVTPASAPPTQFTSNGECNLTFGSYNVENLAPNSSHLAAVAEHIADYLRTPDLVFLQEIQDNDGPTDSGTVSASITLESLTDEIFSLTGLHYSHVDIPPVNNLDGGQPGGNIRTAYLYNPSTLTLLNPTPITPSTSTTALRVLPGGILSHNPGRIDPLNPAFTNSRKPLVAAFLPTNSSSKSTPSPIYAINVHFQSKGGSTSLHGSPRPPVNAGVLNRLAQATLVRDFINDLLAEDPSALVITAGDFNEFSVVAPMKVFHGVMWDLDEVVGTKVEERYSYLFDMNSQTLDHMLVSHALKNHGKPSFEHVHVNSWASRNDVVSDHDPGVAMLAVCH
ncbi:Endonuclease/exonuclease/phosphatase [Tirmania nivea]|nr:Endonuclease/exonuclease/phosphatase [Tirmania nivea]